MLLIASQNAIHFLHSFVWVTIFTLCHGEESTRVRSTLSPVGPKMCHLACQKHGDCEVYQFTAKTVQCVLRGKTEEARVNSTNMVQNTVQPKLDCGELAVSNGRLNEGRGEVECNDKFHFIGHDPKVTCSDTGVWIGPNGTCFQVNWQNVKVPTNRLLRAKLKSLSLKGEGSNEKNGFSITLGAREQLEMALSFSAQPNCTASNTSCTIHAMINYHMTSPITVPQPYPFYSQVEFHLQLLVTRETLKVVVDNIELKAFSREKVGLTTDFVYFLLDGGAIINEMTISYYD